MNEMIYQIGVVFSENPGLKWMIVIAGILLLVLSLYKLFFEQTVSPNGRITTQFKQPRVQLRKPSVNIKLKRRDYSPRAKKLMSAVYMIQQIVFGTILFGFGLALCALTYQWLSNSVLVPTLIWPLLTGIFGLIAIACGFLAVLYRNRDNPFTD